MKRIYLAATFTALALSSVQAGAQGTDEFGAYGGKEREGQIGSPQNMAFEFRIGPYLPRIDSEFSNGATPFGTAFRNKKRILIGIEVDYQALRIPYFGTIGPGIGWGYTSMGGKALLKNNQRSDQAIGLSIMPMYLVGVLRVDYLSRHTVVPLAFYAKAGLGYALWWSTSGGQLARVDGVKAQGTSYGYHFALGAMLNLNVFDRAAATEMDNATGINSAYLFGEFYMSNLNGFGTGRLQVGANTWTTGLAFEF